jgi:hypothetical protein
MVSLRSHLWFIDAIGCLTRVGDGTAFRPYVPECMRLGLAVIEVCFAFAIPPPISRVFVVVVI